MNILVTNFISQVTIKALICLVDRKTGEKSKTRPRFIKQDQIAIVRYFEISFPLKNFYDEH